MSLSDPVVHSERPDAAAVSGEAASEFERWQSPEFESGGTGGSSMMSVTQLEALQQAAYDEAYAVGLQEGREAGATVARHDGQRLGDLIQQLARPFETLDDSVEKQVVQLALVVARHIIRRELKTDPTHVIGAVREALAVLPVASRGIRVKLHPQDAELVRQYLEPVEGERAWSIEEDPVLSRGSCLVDTEYSHVDARIESRLSALVASLFGDERDSSDDDASTLTERK